MPEEISNNPRSTISVKEWIAKNPDKHDLFREAYNEGRMGLVEIATLLGIPTNLTGTHASAPKVSHIAKELGCPPKIAYRKKAARSSSVSIQKETPPERVKRLKAELAQASMECIDWQSRDEIKIRKFVEEMGGVAAFYAVYRQIKW